MVETGIDVVVFQKRYRSSDIDLARRLTDRGVSVCFDLCDNHRYSLTLAGDRKSLRDLDAMLDLASLVTVSTDVLASQIDRVAVVIDDAIEPIAGDASERFGRLRHRRGARTLVWFGSAGSKLPQFGIPDLADRLVDIEHVNAHQRTRLEVVSNDRGLFDELMSSSAVPTRYHPWRSDSAAHRRIANADACVLPTSNNPFTEAKSPNRAVLSLLLGTPVAATLLPSLDSLRHLVTIDERFDRAIESVLSDHEANVGRLALAREELPRRFSPAAVASRWRDVLTTVVAT